MIQLQFDVPFKFIAKSDELTLISLNGVPKEIKECTLVLAKESTIEPVVTINFFVADERVPENGMLLVDGIPYKEKKIPLEGLQEYTLTLSSNTKVQIPPKAEVILVNRYR